MLKSRSFTKLMRCKVATNQNIHVLVIEDLNLAQITALHLFKKLKCQVHIVAEATRALELILKIPYDIIFIDIQLPDMNGFELASTIRGIEKRHHHLPLIAVTANSYEELGDRSKEAGFSDYLIKPLTIENIRHMLLKHLNKAKRQKISPNESLD